MKKLASLLTCTALLAALSGCGTTPPTGTTVPTQLPPLTEAETTVPETIAPEAPDPAGSHVPAISIALTPHEEISTVEGDEETKLLIYRWQDIQVTAPNGAGENITSRLERNHGLSRDFADELLRLATAEQAGRAEFRPYSYEVALTPQRADETVISFSGVIWSFTGGVHPNQNHIAISYDTATGDPLRLSQVFPGENAMDTVRQLVVQKLAEEADGLYPGYEDLVADCLSTDKTPYGFYYFTSEGLVFFFSPYVIAPYARGVVEVKLSYEELDGLLDPKWLPASASAAGTVVLSADKNTDITLAASQGGQQVMLEMQGDVSDLRIETHMLNISSDTSRTLYQAPLLEDGTRILLTMPEDPTLSVVVSYGSGDQRNFLMLEPSESGYTLSPMP